VQGPAVPAPAKSIETTQLQGDTLIALTTHAAALKAGEESTLVFTLQQAADQSPIIDLQPYLGAMGHLVIIHESNELAMPDYIHTHALQTDKQNRIAFMTVFPKAGWYKLFGQFNRGGTILTTAFWVRVD
jgi:hypothetical protein